MPTLEPESGNSRVHDYIVIGAGPAGCQMAYFLERDGRDYLVLEREEVGNFFSNFPRFRKLISNNKPNTGFDDPDKNLRWDWNSLLSDELDPVLTTYSKDYFPAADTLVEYLQDFAERYRLKIRTGVRVDRVSRDAETGIFTLTCSDGEERQARRVVVGTGAVHQYRPDFPGAELAEMYGEAPQDPAAYTNQRVMVIGKGNAGFELAENIFETSAVTHMLSPNPVRLAWSTHHVSDVRAVNNNTLDSYQLKMQNTILDGHVRKLEKRDDGKLLLSFQYSHAQGQELTLTVDRVVLCTGFRYDYSIFDESCRPQLKNERFPDLTSSWESANVPDLFFIGTMMQARDYKRSFSGFIHGFRYNIRFLSQVFAERYHATSRAPEQLPADSAAVAAHIVGRMVNASSIFQLPAFLGDVYRVDDDSAFEALVDVPVDYALDHWKDRTLLVTTMEYGHLEPGTDPFSQERDPLDGSTSKFIHPVLRLYRGGELVTTYHVPEDLENEWDKEMYTVPLITALKEMLGR
ncbi:NAD(P)-binding domain-containing protein [Kitasatospora brasiliensis]|uniref:NAD(P)-binding domain-containing protein n=1 Tax=Kitasatospora brasiliensis TaxID=3058040 RepID=UPI00292E8CC9|nr:NAD(P)-binding domain-containing protein [Kitasatospora sp. K002]